MIALGSNICALKARRQPASSSRKLVSVLQRIFRIIRADDAPELLSSESLKSNSSVCSPATIKSVNAYFLAVISARPKNEH